MGQLQAYRADRHTLVFREDERCYKLFKIQFNQGSLFVHVPYYRDCDGIVSVLTLEPGQSHQQVSLSDTGKITSRRVKYSHHPDGLALFSQDSQVVSSVRKQSTALTATSEHLFTLMIQGVSDFEGLPDNYEPRTSPKDHDHVLSPTTAAEAYKFVGEWVDEERFVGQLAHGDVGPWVHVGAANERPDLALVVAARAGSPPHDRFLMLT